MNTSTHFNIDSDANGIQYPTSYNIWKVSVCFAARRSFCVEFYLAIAKRLSVCHSVATHLWYDAYCILSQARRLNNPQQEMIFNLPCELEG